MSFYYIQYLVFYDKKIGSIQGDTMQQEPSQMLNTDSEQMNEHVTDQVHITAVLPEPSLNINAYALESATVRREPLQNFDMTLKNNYQPSSY